MLTVADFASRTSATVALLRQLVEIESPSTDKAAVDRLRALVAGELRRLGAAVTIDGQAVTGDHVIGRWGSGPAGILVMCHLDTVYDLGTLARQPCRETDGKLTGPGVYDMKASLAMTLTALQALQQAGHFPQRPIAVLCTSDEEIGSNSSRALIEKLAAGSALTLCLEPCLPDGSLKTWRKGVGEYEIVARGRSAHSGADHEKGRNAIEELAHQILAAQKLTDYSKGTTLNVGKVRGGTRSNVVPDEARATTDLRVMTREEEQRIADYMAALKPVLEGTSVAARGGINRPPMVRDATMIATFARAQEIGAGLGLKLTEGGTGGASDANFVSPLGVPVLDGLGPQGNGAHSEREHILIASLAEKTALLAGLLTEW